MCAYDTEAGRGPCGGDSGGPLYYNDTGEMKLVGVHKAKPMPCGGYGDTHLAYGMYEDVLKWKDWIDDAMEALNLHFPTVHDK